MKRFLGNVLSSTIGTFFGLGLIFLVMIIIIGAIVSSGEEQKFVLKSESILHLTLDGPILEREKESEFEIDFGNGSPSGIGLNRLLESIENASADDKIEGIFLDLAGVGASLSAAYDIRRSLKAFQDSGKWILAYGENWGQGTYYMGSVADEVYLYPEGGLEFKGAGAELMFFKNMLDKLEIDVQVLRGPNNKYKSAVEPFLYEKMSEANREQYQVLIDDVWDLMLTDMSASRNISKDQFNALADSLKVGMSIDAMAYGLIDDVKYRDEIMDILASKIEKDDDTANEGEDKDDDDELEDHLVSLGDYQDAGNGRKHKRRKKGEAKSDKIAVVYAVGGIESGQGDDETIGSERIAKALRDAREDEHVKAVVLRVNSPGGSALASDVIWRETQLIKEAGLPFVVSMGDVAASGGYYIACGADRIFANENTITGSIGVFGMIPNMEGFFNNKIGLTFDYVETNEHSDMMTASKAMDEAEIAYINKMIEGIYYRFIGLVAEGRGMTTDEVDAIAQGRVWTGRAAMEKGLVDEMGNLEDAIAYAAKQASLEDYKTKEFPKMIDPFEELIKELTGEAEVKAMGEMVMLQDESVIEELLDMKEWMMSGEIQARLPYVIRVK